MSVHVGILGSQGLTIADLLRGSALIAYASARTGQRVKLPFGGARRARKPIDLWRGE